MLQNFIELYTKVDVEINLQEKFLALCNNKLDEDDCEMLTNDITEKELVTVIRSLNNGKAPGMDGLPVEFYKEFLPIIKDELLMVIKKVLDCRLLTSLQNTGLIKLLSKGTKGHTLSDWRPISLLNVDCKIIAKLLANRLKHVMYKLISGEQYCSVKGKSIVNCNNNIRDIIHYVNENKLTGAILKLDWAKAFDTVDHELLFKIMKKLGIPCEFIEWIKILYKNCMSCLCINGYVGNPFHIERSVRQGCPLSMLLFVIYQEPLYLEIKHNRNIKPPQLPNAIDVCIQGYADDTSIFIANDQSLTEVCQVISEFEKASGAKLNRDKCSITGMGNWMDRTDWPIPWLRTETDLKILGIFYCQTEIETLEKNWDSIVSKVERAANMLSDRYLSLFQKAIIINSMLLSKVWYVSHTLPLSKKYAQRINSIIFRYLWKGKYQPVGRATLFLPKKEGGLNIVSVYHKAASILAATSLKETLAGREMNIYYSKMRLSYLIDTAPCTDVSYVTPTFYAKAIEGIRLVCKDKKFPILNSKDIYCQLFSKVPAKVESNYPLLSWGKIWENINNELIGIREREFLYKYMHEVLPTNVRLKFMKLRDSENCEFCNDIEFTMHIFYFCSKIKNFFNWFCIKLASMCSITNNNWLKLLFFDFDCKTNRDRNTAIILVCNYLYVVWIGRTKNLNEREMICYFKGRLNFSKWTLKLVYRDKLRKLVTKEFLENIM